jgi:Transglutaminase-like superfamily
VSALSAVLTPWYRRSSTSAGDGPHIPGSISQTVILDFESPEIQRLVVRARLDARSSSPFDVISAAYAIIRDEVRPVYALDESTPSSRTLRRGKGSCSQRLAILESVARAVGVPTRVRALLVDRSFWYPRFPRVGLILPHEIMLVWPEFEFEGSWRSVSDLFGAIGCHGGGRFTNSGAETLFEAIGRCAVDWDGRSHDVEYDLSNFVRTDHGYFADRDRAFARLGQTLSSPFRIVADLVLRNVSA